MTTALAVRDEEGTYGDCWQGDELNRLVALLDRNGYGVVPGTLDHAGLSVLTPLGARARLNLVRPGVLRAVAEDGKDAVPSDQYPALDRFGEAGEVREDLDELDRIVRGDRWGVAPND